jgi:hypothetical protein
MTEIRPSNPEPEQRSANGNTEPMFRRYQIKVKTGVRAGAVPTGHPPIGY